MSKLWTLVSVVIGVFAASAIFGWVMFKMGKAMDRLNSDSSYRRRYFILLASVYVVSMVVGVGEVVLGYQPLWSLVGLPIPLLFVYFLLRTVGRTKTPPQ